jgi:hypothetical protein
MKNARPPKKLAKPRRWNRSKDARCCIQCEREFKMGDVVYTDAAVNVHVGCLGAYAAALRGLGLVSVEARTGE